MPTCCFAGCYREAHHDGAACPDCGGPSLLALCRVHTCRNVSAQGGGRKRGFCHNHDGWIACPDCATGGWRALTRCPTCRSFGYLPAPPEGRTRETAPPRPSGTSEEGGGTYPPPAPSFARRSGGRA